MNDKLLVDALKEGDSEPVHLEINIEDYVGEDGGTNYSSQFKNLGKLVADVDKSLLSKLSKSLQAGCSDKKPSSESRGLRETDQPFVGTSYPPDDYPVHDPSGVYVPPVPAYGGSDLFPGPGAGMYPTRGDFGGSMLVGPQDPRFFGGIREPGLPGGLPDTKFVDIHLLGVIMSLPHGQVMFVGPSKEISRCQGVGRCS